MIFYITTKFYTCRDIVQLMAIIIKFEFICEGQPWWVQSSQTCINWCVKNMMTSSNGNIFCVTGTLGGGGGGGGDSSVTGEFPAQGSVTRSFDAFSLICTWINGWVNNREAGDLRRHFSLFDFINLLFNNYPWYHVHPINMIFLLKSELKWHWPSWTKTSVQLKLKYFHRTLQMDLKMFHLQNIVIWSLLTSNITMTQENDSENVACKTTAILFWLWPRGFDIALYR